MAFTKPKMNQTALTIANLAIYLRSVKKWGKSTLYRDVVRVIGDGDLSKGVLVECGMETGDTMLDMNMTHVDSYADLVELKDWLINEKGKEHNIETVCFDTADELVPIFESEVIRMHNKENPMKKVKSIKAAFGGFNAGIDMAASMIKQYMSEIKKAGFGIMVIAHSKFKTIREKGGLEEDGYMQLTSTLGASYESCFGDIFDCTLTGVIDRVYDEKNDKKYATDSIRKLYFRGTNLIDAGGRFANGTVPEYLEYPTDMDSYDFAKLFVDTVNNGLSGSKLDPKDIVYTKVNNVEIKPNKLVSNPVPDDTDIPEEETDTADVVEEDLFEEETPKFDLAEIKKAFSGSDKETKTKIKGILTSHGNGKLDGCDDEGLAEICEILDLNI